MLTHEIAKQQRRIYYYTVRLYVLRYRGVCVCVYVKAHNINAAHSAPRR